MAVTLAQYDELMTALPSSSAVVSLPFVRIAKTASGRCWCCLSGEHRYHRIFQVAQQCAVSVMPMVSLDA